MSARATSITPSCTRRGYAAGSGASSPGNARAAQNVLMRQYFCPARHTAIRDAKEGVAALQAGGHPAKELQQY